MQNSVQQHRQVQPENTELIAQKAKEKLELIVLDINKFHFASAEGSKVQKVGEDKPSTEPESADKASKALRVYAVRDKN